MRLLWPDSTLGLHHPAVNSPPVTEMETNNMLSMQHILASQGCLTETGNVWFVTSQPGEQSVKPCQVLDSLNPAATNWLEPSESNIGGEEGGGSKWRELAITTPTTYTHKWWAGNGVKGLGLQHRVTGSSHKVRIAGWAKLQTEPAFQSHAPSFHLLETDTRLSVLSLRSYSTQDIKLNSIHLLFSVS